MYQNRLLPALRYKGLCLSRYLVYGALMMNIRISTALRRNLSLLALTTAFVLLSACGKSSTSSHYAYPDSTSGFSIAACARSQLGKPYCSGGISPQTGFDCSGLVYWACSQNGIRVPRVSKDQASTGKKISLSSLRPGDIVVFKTSWRGYHTGIYLGQNRFIHSPRPRTRVRIDSLTQEYWKEHFVSGRRVAAP